MTSSLDYGKKAGERLNLSGDRDTDGFAACGRDQARETKYQARLARELRVYGAMREGRHVYDEEQRTCEEATR
ncbi:MAG: hypothetical protein WC328_15905 [Kiritimatiellia bacterium]|nr:hypothetical protein [Kiritimatiellia bacterium]